jgi:hypothetical protein
MAKSCYEEAYATEGKSVNDIGDARRHCHWSCCLTKKLGAEMAKVLGDAHEFGDPNSKECERNMDLNNNAQGRQVGLSGADCSAGCRQRPLQDKPAGSCETCKRVFFGIGSKS